MSGIEEVASAFEQSINPASARSEKIADTPTENVERLFHDGSDEEHDDDEAINSDTGEHDTHDVDGTDDGEPDGDDTDTDDVDADDGAEDEAGSVDAPALDAKVSVTVDGEPVTVTVKEALEGYIRTETFHKRLNEVNEAKKVVEQEGGEVAQAREMYTTMLTTLSEQLDSLTPSEPDWDKKFAADPVAALQEQRQWDKFKVQRAAIDTERNRVMAEQQREHTVKFAQFVEGEKKLMAEKNPQWTDPVKGAENWKRDKVAMDKTAKAAGFTDADINGIFDHRMITVLHKAAQYDRIKAAQPKPVNGGNKPMRSGSGASRTGQRDTSREMNRLTRTGSVNDAASLFQKMLNSEG